MFRIYETHVSDVFILTLTIQLRCKYRGKLNDRLGVHISYCDEGTCQLQKYLLEIDRSKGSALQEEQIQVIVLYVGGTKTQTLLIYTLCRSALLTRTNKVEVLFY